MCSYVYFVAAIHLLDHPLPSHEAIDCICAKSSTRSPKRSIPKLREQAPHELSVLYTLWSACIQDHQTAKNTYM